MKVLLTADTVGGVWDHAVVLARALARTGHEVLVAVIGEPHSRPLARLPDGVQVVWRSYRLEWMADAGADVRAAGEWLSSLADAWRPEVVHLNQMAYAVHPFSAPVLVAVHSDVLSWWLEVLGEPDAARRNPEYARWTRAGLAAADAVVAPTEYQAALVRRQYRVGDVRVIHNGLPGGGAPRAEREAVALGAGRAWDAGKGMDVLDAAAGLLDDPAFPVHVVGDVEGPGGEHFRARHLVMHGRVEREEVDRRMSHAAVFVSASRYEPFGLGPLEAALHGCALVLSDIGSYRELWDGCAAFFPRGDAAALAAALRRLRDDPDRRASLARAARTRAVRRYTDAAMARAYASLYRELAGRRPAPVLHAAGPDRR
jgi:glycosyltransferase involved in cell wall biosynthesis